jgi:hypothetical protein
MALMHSASASRGVSLVFALKERRLAPRSSGVLMHSANRYDFDHTSQARYLPPLKKRWLQSVKASPD